MVHLDTSTQVSVVVLNLVPDVQFSHKLYENVTSVMLFVMLVVAQLIMGSNDTVSMANDITPNSAATPPLDKNPIFN